MRNTFNKYENKNNNTGAKHLILRTDIKKWYYWLMKLI